MLLRIGNNLIVGFAIAQTIIIILHGQITFIFSINLQSMKFRGEIA
ncbi:hypothetical protein BMETH_1922_0 [methanotrophic bacterial endosymbiont of Bathymodiolus sp.]|nr:hypothetical protein BMETH_1922_0 [methanotrophic bacterial endosymbiont of Bathymodiolus sp.]